MLVHNEQIVHEYLEWAMCGEPHPKGKFKIYAVEGGTAAMCYIFKSLKCNRILNQGDTIALACRSSRRIWKWPTWKTTTSTLLRSKLPQENRPVHQGRAGEARGSAGQGLLPRQSGEPRCRRHRPSVIEKIVRIVKTKRPDLIILTDDVYGTFVPGFRSLAAELPTNTILVYSYSKHFGCTGWRLGVIALHEDNVIDRIIARLPDAGSRGRSVGATRASRSTPDQ